MTAAALRQAGWFVATANKDWTVRVLGAWTRKPFSTYNGYRRPDGPHTGLFEVYGVGVEPAGVAYSAGAGAAVRAWEPVKVQEENGSTADAEKYFAKAGHTHDLPFVAALPALAVVGRQVFTAVGDGNLTGLDPISTRLAREFAVPADRLYAVVADRRGARAAAARVGATVRA